MKIRKELFTFLYSLAFYLAVTMIPLERWIKGSGLLLLCQMLLRIGLLIFFYFDEYFHKKKLETKFRLTFAYVPFLIGATSNYLCLPFTSFEVMASSLGFREILLNIGIILFSVMCEEYIFRHLGFLLFGHLFADSSNKDVLTIVFTSLVFALAHGINILGSGVWTVLAQIGYTFVLGIILGYLKMDTGHSSMSILGHFIFNLSNSFFFTLFFAVEINLAYFVISIVIAGLEIIYVTILHHLFHHERSVS